MADDDPIVQTLTLEGGDTAMSDFQKFGEAGVKAFDDMYDAAQKANTQLDEVSAASRKFGEAIRDAASSAVSFVSTIGKIGGGIAGLVTGYIAATKAIVAHNAASNTSQQSTRQLTQQVRASEQGLLDQQLAAVSNARAFQDLTEAQARGELATGEYTKKFLELQRQQKHAAEDQRASARIQQQATEDRLKEVAALQKQQEAQQEYNDLVAKFGAPLTSALEDIGRALNDVFTDFKQTFGPAVAELVRNLADGIRENAGRIHDLFQSMADALKPFTDDGGKRVQSMVTGIVSALRVAVEFIKSVVVPAFETIFTVLDKVADIINGMFGTKFTGAGIAAVIIIGNVTGAFKALYDVGKLIVALGELISKTPWGLAFTALVIIIGLLIEHFGGVEEVLKKLSAAWESATAYMKQVGNEWLDWFEKTWIGRAISGINKLIDKFQQLGKAQDNTASGQNLKVDEGDLSGATEVQSDGSGEGDKFAGGGRVRGAGTSTSDSIRAWLSNNEWVIRARAAAYYGNSVMNAMNNMRLDPALLRSLVGDGGGGTLVPQPGRTHFATGGQVSARSPGRPFSLVIGREVFEDLTAPEQTAARLVQFAISKGSRSAGKRQEWVGARS